MINIYIISWLISFVMCQSSFVFYLFIKKSENIKHLELFHDLTQYNQYNKNQEYDH